MKILTMSGVVTCAHQGIVGLASTATWLRINGAAVLVDHDPEGKGIAGCPNMSTTIKPCTTTLSHTKGPCSWITANGAKVILDDLQGKTDGTPPGTVNYTVQFAGHEMVDVS